MKTHSALCFACLSLAWLATTLGAAPVSAAPTPEPTSDVADIDHGTPAASLDPMAALEQGNQLFESGDIEGAIAAYRSGLDADNPHTTLIYNLATALHHSGELPEAVLWYKRGSADDPWTEENLWLARKSLGSQRLPLTGVSGWLHNHGPKLADALVAWIWLAGLSVILLPSSRLRPAVGAAALGTVCYIALVIAQSRAPEAAVLLEDCATAAGELPAGTEAWVLQTAQGWSIAGVDGGFCPEGTVAIVNP